MSRKYYEAYDDRYRQAHSRKLQWFHTEPSPIVAEVMNAFGVQKGHKLLEIGCGEGRDAIPLMKAGYDLVSTDISQEAIRFCKKKAPEFAQSFRMLDCVNGSIEEKFDFIYAIAVIHMLVDDADRAAFYRFYFQHLEDEGFGLICSMGDGSIERCSDVSTAFVLQERIHEQSGEKLSIAGTSCRIVDFKTFHREMNENGLEILRSGITVVAPDFPQMMYAVVKKRVN